MASKRKTSRELTEIRTVLSRAKTALESIPENPRAVTSEAERPSGYPRDYRHSAYELSMMRSALLTAIDVLGKVEEEYGYSVQD